VQRAEPAHAQVLQHPQQLGLQRQVEFADFVEQQRAAVGRFDQANLAGVGIGEGALFVAEQLALDQVRGSAAQLISMNGALARGPAWWQARATSSLPVPVSPRIRIGAAGVWSAGSMAGKRAHHVAQALHGG
jgi:hypothetical protein